MHCAIYKQAAFTLSRKRLQKFHHLIVVCSDLSAGCRWPHRSSPAPGDTGPGRSGPLLTGCPAPAHAYNLPEPCHAAAASHGREPCWCSTLPLMDYGSGRQDTPDNTL